MKRLLDEAEQAMDKANLTAGRTRVQTARGLLAALHEGDQGHAHKNAFYWSVSNLFMSTETASIKKSLVLRADLMDRHLARAGIAKQIAAAV